jgi:hypothetical protein
MFSRALLLAISLTAATEPLESPQQLVTQVVTNETKAAQRDHSRWTYLSTKIELGKRETRRVFETTKGKLSYLTFVDGKPLSKSDQKTEYERIEKLAHNADELESQHKKDEDDIKKIRALLKLVDRAFLFNYVGQQGRIRRLTFQPDPKFVPQSHEARVLHSMAGTILIDSKEKRLVALKGQMIQDVKFGGGLLAHIDRGGTFALKRKEIKPRHWETTLIDVHLKGRALLFKGINEQHHELRREFRPLPQNFTPEEAVDMLNADAN